MVVADIKMGKSKNKSLKKSLTKISKGKKPVETDSESEEDFGENSGKSFLDLQADEDNEFDEGDDDSFIDDGEDEESDSGDDYIDHEAKEDNTLEGDEDEEDGDNEEEKDEENDSEEEEEESVDPEQHKKSLKKLKSVDPEFYKYLEENDKDLLKFGASSDEDDSDEDDEEKGAHVPPDNLEGHSDESDFEEDPTGGEYVEDGTVRKVTLTMVSKWREDLQKSKNISTIAIVTKAFHAALYRILEEDDEQPLKFKVEGGGIFNAVVQLCVVDLKPALLRTLKIEDTGSNKLGIEKSKMWPRVKSLLKHYLIDLIKLLGAVSSADIIAVLLKHLHSMLIFLSVLGFNFKPLLRQLVSLWSKSEDETVRIISFLNLLRLTVNNKRKHLENVLKYMYTGYIANSKFVSPSTYPNINFMRKSLAEMFSLDEPVAYQHTFLYVRQLAIHLRNAITLHTKQSYQTVYNWQYLASLKLWTTLLCNGHSNDKKQLSTLLYPLIQIIIGVIKLIPTSTYFPLRFHCIEMLNQISAETGLFIPTAPLILEAFQIYDLNKKHSKVSMKPLDFTCILRLNKIHLVENGFKNSIVDLVYQHLLNYMQIESTRMSFPDLCIPVVIQLRNFIKSSKVPNYSRKMKQLLDKIEETSRFVEEERRKAAIPLANKDSIKTWENKMRSKGTPLTQFYLSWKKINDQKEAKRHTDSDNLGDFKLPSLKRSLPKDKKEKDDGPVELFPSDDEDDDIAFGNDSDQGSLEDEIEDMEDDEDDEEDDEEEEEEPEKKKRKRNKNKNRKKKDKKAKFNKNKELNQNGSSNGINVDDISDDVKDVVVDFKSSKFK